MEYKIIWNWLKYKIFSQMDDTHYRRNRDAELVMLDLIADCGLYDVAMRVYKCYQDYTSTYNIDIVEQSSFFNMTLSDKSKTMRNTIKGWTEVELSK